MEIINVKSSSHNYSITLGNSIRFNLKQYIKKDYQSIMIITDQTVADLYLDDLRKNFINKHVIESIIPVGEQSKNIDLYYQLQTEAIEGGLDRGSLILALGGGVVGDLAGFVAATFLRGIDFIQVPTTILAHDSSVGGKVAINHDLGKNLIGCFYPPKAVIYDIETLKTLSTEQVRSGYAELVKEALIADKSFFDSIIMSSLDTLSPEKLKDHIKQGIKVKASIVESDERESGVRKFLNLGHTLGHALEAELGYGNITHGEAVAIGLLFALYISEQKYQVDLAFTTLHGWLIQNYYPIELFNIDSSQLVEKMQHDKKIINQKVQMILLEKVGEPVLVDMTNDDIHDYLFNFKERLANI